MFARVSVYEIPGEQMDEAVEKFTAAIEEISACDGFAEAFFLVSAGDERATAVTFWTSGAAMEASGVTASRLRSEAARSVDGTVVSTQQYEIAARVSTTSTVVERRGET